ncbi:MAG: NrtA/SsuA/CpmA family ABC transporter substrate-binding protein [bacterium]|nr:NrtA/SsuA/CpmA family ABC transporter substrate-binding protein [bacterium]
MRLKKLLATALVGTMVITSLVGCGNKAEEKSLSAINLTYVKAPLNVPSILQKNDELFANEFKEDGITVNWHEITSGPDQTAALAAGELDFLHALGGTSALIAASNGVELEILNTYSRSPKGFMIVANNEAITSAKDLVGKKVAGPKGTILHQVLIAALQAEGYSIDDVEFIQMTIPDAAAALADGSVDAALTAGPNALTAINSGSHVVATGEGLVDGIIVTAVSKKFADENPEIVERFMKVEEETLAYVKDNYEEAMEKVSAEVGLTVDQVKEMYDWYDFSLDITDADIKALEETQDFLIENELQETKVDINSLIYKK